MKGHILYEINLERKTVICINRARELWLNKQASRKSLREEKRQKPDWKPRHTLTDINPETLRATCAICGRTDIRKVSSRGYSRYDCLTKARNYLRVYKRSRYIARSTNPHALSKIDEEKKTAVCAKCGPVKIEIWLGKKKVNRRCINARNELDKAVQNLEYD